jgi:hypothetical protein
VYEKGKSLEFWVDSEEYSIIDMEKDVAHHFSWAINQEPNFWFVAPHNGLITRLGTDQELLTLLRDSKLVKFIMTIDRCEHVSLSQREDRSQVIDEENALQVLVTNEDNGLQVEVIRGMIMEKIATRQHIASRLQGPILNSVIHELKMKSRNLKYIIKGSGGLKAEISGLTKDNYPWRHVVDLELKTCSCNQWQISGKPCTHAVCFIFSLRQVKLEDYVHEYYSLE